MEELKREKKSGRESERMDREERGKGRMGGDRNERERVNGGRGERESERKSERKNERMSGNKGERGNRKNGSLSNSPSPRYAASYSNSPISRQNSVRKTELVVKSPRVNKEVKPLKVVTTPVKKTKSSSTEHLDYSTPYMPLVSAKPVINTLPVNHELEELRREEEVIDMIEEIKRFSTQYPDMGIKIPKHDDNYQLIKERRNMYDKKIAIKQKVKDYQIYILIGAGILELLGTFVLGVDVDEFTVEQYKLLNKYEKDLENYAKTNYGGLLDNQPSEYKIIFTMFGYYFIMIIVKFILSKLPMAGMKDSIAETIMYLMRGNDIGSKTVGPVGETSPAAKLVGDLAGYFPMLKMFMNNKEGPSEKKAEMPPIED